MPLFANTWINLNLKQAANDVIVHHNVRSFDDYIVKTKPPVPVKRKVAIAPLSPDNNKHLKSAYFRDMITVEKHSKAGYSKDVLTSKHRKSSYVKEFIT